MQSARKFSAVLGTTSAKSSKVILPASLPLMSAGGVRCNTSAACQVQLTDVEVDGGVLHAQPGAAETTGQRAQGRGAGGEQEHGEEEGGGCHSFGGSQRQQTTTTRRSGGRANSTRHPLPATRPGGYSTSSFASPNLGLRRHLARESPSYSTGDRSSII